MSGNSAHLSVKNLSVKFTQYEKGLRRKELEVISGLDVEVCKGEIVAVVGSSGSGKSLLAHAVLGILPENAALTGDILYGGERLTEKRLETLRGGEIALIPQSTTYLNPLMKAGRQVMGTKHSLNEVKDMFVRYNLPPETVNMYPHQLSGGMTRRVLICAAVLGGAKLIIADEPTAGLSERLAYESFLHLRELADMGCAVLLITHDIKMALSVSDKIAVFYAGTTLEIANKADFEGEGENLRHPYTKALWQALPENGFKPHEGTQPYSGSVTDKCRFYERCDSRGDSCLKSIKMRGVKGGMVRCIYAS